MRYHPLLEKLSAKLIESQQLCNFAGMKGYGVITLEQKQECDNESFRIEFIIKMLLEKEKPKIKDITEASRLVNQKMRHIKSITKLIHV